MWWVPRPILEEYDNLEENTSESEMAVASENIWNVYDGAMTDCNQNTLLRTLEDRYESCRNENMNSVETSMIEGF